MKRIVSVVLAGFLTARIAEIGGLITTYQGYATFFDTVSCYRVLNDVGQAAGGVWCEAS